MLRVLDRKLGGQGHLDVMNVLGRPQGSHCESFMSIASLEVCQEWWVLHRGTWRTLRVPDRRLARKVHP